jgi:hypothetical protein
MEILKKSERKNLLVKMKNNNITRKVLVMTENY